MRFTDLRPLDDLILESVKSESMTVHGLAHELGIPKLTIAKKLPRLKRTKMLGIQRGVIYSGCETLIEAFLDGRSMPRSPIRDQILSALRYGPRRRRDLIELIGKKHQSKIDTAGCLLASERLIVKERGVWRLYK